jgi:hypothetical protein
MRRKVVVLLGLLVACGPARTTTDTHPSAQVVPWIDTAFAASTPSPLPTGVDHCSAADLELGAFGDLGAAAGTSYTEAEVRNGSSSACVLTSKVAVHYLDEDGETVQTSPLETSQDAVLVPTERSVGNGAAERIHLRIAIPGVCPPQVATSLAIRLFPGTETMQLPPGSGGPSPSPGECAEAGHYTLSVEPAGTEPSSPLAVFDAEIRAPDTVTPGTTFLYRVHLTNPSLQAVTLDPCPGYSEGFKAPNGGQASYLLNCSDVKVIAAGQTIIYEMELEVPENFGPETNPQRRALLGWTMIGGGPSASAEVEVLG